MFLYFLPFNIKQQCVFFAAYFETIDSINGNFRHKGVNCCQSWWYTCVPTRRND